MSAAWRVLMLAGLTVSAAQAGEYLQTLKPGCWVCTSPEAYDQAVAEQRRADGDLEELKRRLLEQKLCMYVDAEYVEKMMVPYATILERQGSKVKVTFTVDFRKRLALLHRQITRITYAGWTDAANLVDREIL
jgi:hypothetical protein